MSRQLRKLYLHFVIHKDEDFFFFILSLAACGNSGSGAGQSSAVPESQPEETGTSEVQAESGGNSEGQQAEHIAMMGF